ncbi:hypothetical protein GCM10023153_16030 [Ornithinibacter aureus]|uniref:OmpA-like domain-containing protein n=1 Tax=Ornithinibacter aureus TaxID=622664 RepID=A0ABP8JQW2_9MICO|nr:OmpA family protein [Ornithinibacter aureus]KAF0834431.1 outer membrane protein OmpA-like peptidoglycan-associated protein [Ornithinibacter aureus]
MTTIRSSLRSIGAATAVGAVLLVGMPAGSSAAGTSAADEVPILGQAFTMGTVQSGPPAVVTVHGVRRVEGATILYWSLGVPVDSPVDNELSFLGPATSSFYAGNVGPTMGDAALTDVTGAQVYRPLVTTEKFAPCACSPVSSLLKVKPGQASVMWTALAPLPEGVTTVDVTVAEQVVPDVTVEEGLLLPVASEQEPVIVGMGWPEVDMNLVGTSTPQDPESYSLVGRVSDLERAVTTSQGEVSLASDVLFAKNSATLTAKGVATVAKAAAQIKASEAGTALTVTGHADSDDSEDYNQALSERRAKAVAAALTKELGSGYSITAVGKGETQPIASNATAAGKAKNRRVSITYTEGQ